ncbi:MAG: MerR family transcriptional regulator [Firmicutes bacterium]|nr:MerR family transcriptional regulator [Bacillota bacterium]
MRPLRTSDIARAVGIHPNTVRVYEQWGFLPPVPRSESGYRLFSGLHLEQVRLVRMALRCTQLGGAIRRQALGVVERAAGCDFPAAGQQARDLWEMVRREREVAEAAVIHLEQWAEGRTGSEDLPGMRISEAAALVGVSIDRLRDWERNGLLSVPREESSGYRVYGPAEIERLQVISAMRKARYSQMSILRVLQTLDRGNKEGLRQALDSPAPDDELYYHCVFDQWRQALAEAEENARRMIGHLEKMSLWFK